MTTERRRLRAALKWALRPQPDRSFEQNGRLKDWAVRKLEGLLAYGLADKSGLSQRAVESVQMHYVQGVPVENIACHYGVTPRTIARDMVMVLDHVLDQTPNSILASLQPIVFQWKMKGCTHLQCGGDLYWDSVGAYGGDGEYCCLMCGRRYTADGEPLRKEG